MEPNLNNPAGRLHAILSELKSSSTGTQTIQVWAKALKVDDVNSSLPLLLVRLGKVYAMPGQIRAAMEELPDYHQREVDRWHLPLAKAFQAAHLKTTWNQVSNFFSPDILADIESNSVRLSRYRGASPITEDKLKRLREEFSNLKETISEASDISEESKKRILGQIERVLNVIDDIWLEGTDRLEVEVQATVGEVTTRPEANPSNGENKTIKQAKDILTIALLTLNIISQGFVISSQLPSPSNNDTNSPKITGQTVDDDGVQDVLSREIKELEQN